MPRRIKVPTIGNESFGQRLARIRKATGFTQVELAHEIGISQRMVAYYERETDQPPSALLPLIARILGVSTDELLGLRPPRKRKRRADSRLTRRLRQLDKLSPRTRRQVVQLIDMAIEREALRKKAS